MDSRQRTAFTDEAERKLRTVRSSILVSLQEGRPAAVDPVATIGGLRQEAARLHLEGVAAVLEALEGESIRLFDPRRSVTDSEALAILDLISHSEAEVVKLRVSNDEGDVASFVDESFEALLGPMNMTETAGDEALEQDGDGKDEFEPDAEMLEVFSMEAEELLANIESSLERLSSSPADRDALWEIRRHAHTFKGAAGIIGLKKPSRLAHRIEDLLDRLAQDEVVPDRQIVELIASATECLRAITGGDLSPGTTARTSAVYAAFDKVLSGVSDDTVVAPEPATNRTPDPPAAVAETPAAAGETASARRPIVRVSINRLDNLVRMARDLVVSRAAVDQRLASLESQLEALGHTTRRLQSAHAKIETDFEASMLQAFVPGLYSRPAVVLPSGSDDGGQEHFDALELDRYTDFHESARELSEAIQDCFSIGTSLEALKASLDTVIEDQRRLIEETQEKVMQIRLIRFESLTARLQRAVRITCEEERKDAEVFLENPDVELDTDVLDSLVEPLMHLLRNAVVHGIEPPETRRLLGKPEKGRITVRITDQETHIELKVSDDGRGIDVTALRARAEDAGMFSDGIIPESDLILLLALPGLTTAEKLTMSAGRGVGMGIVRESVAIRGGTLTVETVPQMGTIFTIKVPLAFAVTRALLVRTERRLVAVPFKAVKRIVEISSADIRSDGSGSSVETEAGVYPLRRISDQFSQGRPDTAKFFNVLLIETDDVRYALVVDEVLKTEEVAVKPLLEPLDRIPGVLGAAVLGNGEVTPVLDVTHFSVPAAVQAEPEVPAVQTEQKPAVVLVVDDSPSVRHMTSKVVTNSGWTVLTAKDGLEALEILAGGGQLPDLILSDVEMPRMDGYELAAAIKSNELFRGIPLVFITSRAGDKHREKAEALGVTEYLTKPFIDAELVGTVARLTATPVPA